MHPGDLCSKLGPLQSESTLNRKIFMKNSVWNIDGISDLDLPQRSFLFQLDNPKDK